MTLEELSKNFDVYPDRFVMDTFVITFYVENKARVTVSVGFEDQQSGADMVIKTMTTLPESEQGKGHGRKALTLLLGWAKQKGMKEIQVVQVQEVSEPFWEKMGFVRLGNRCNDFRFVG